MLILLPIFFVGVCIISNLNEKTLSGLLGHHYYEDNEIIDESDLSDNDLSDNDTDIYDEIFIKKNK
jgi:hypothetical protein